MNRRGFFSVAAGLAAAAAGAAFVGRPAYAFEPGIIGSVRYSTPLLTQPYTVLEDGIVVIHEIVCAPLAAGVQGSNLGEASWVSVRPLLSTLTPPAIA
jgi:hypothetical protein